MRKENKISGKCIYLQTQVSGITFAAHIAYFEATSGHVCKMNRKCVNTIVDWLFADNHLHKFFLAGDNFPLLEASAIGMGSCSALVADLDDSSSILGSLL